MQRRNFLKLSALLSGNFAWLPAVYPVHSAEPDLAHASGTLPDETFWKFVRKQFLLPEHYAYFNTGGLGASPYIVLENVIQEMREREIRPAPGIDMEKWLATKAKIAQLIQAVPDEIAFTNSATDGNNIILNGLPFQKGDEIITSTHEHSGLEIPLLNTVRRRDVIIRTFDPDLDNGLGNVDRIERLINKRTRLIFISHFTCTTGQRFAVREICQLAQAAGIWCALDGAQVVGNMPFNVKEIDCDFYATCGHKWMLGPKRTGFLYVKKSMLDFLEPSTVGAYSEASHDIRSQQFQPHPTAQRFEYATQNDALYAGLGVAIDFLNQIGLQRIWERNRKLAEQFYTELEKIPEVELVSPAEEIFRTSMITFKPKKNDFRQLARTLGNRDFRVRQVSEAQVNGIRISMHLYNNEAEVEKLVNEIKKLVV